MFDARPDSVERVLLRASDDLAIDGNVFRVQRDSVQERGMIYFSTRAEESSLRLVAASLSPFGMLCLGSRESLRCTEYESASTS